MDLKKAAIYIHGKGGSVEEADHYQSLFPEHTVIGFDYKSQVPWEAQKEFSTFFQTVKDQYQEVILIANSIGAFFSLFADNQKCIGKAYFISPVVDMEALIMSMMQAMGVSEDELRQKGIIETSFGEPLSWEYLTWVRKHPVQWSVPTEILYGDKDIMQSMDTIRAFAEKTSSVVTVMEGGEHWFHEIDQMAFLYNWIVSRL